jgi:hypothetical protein
MASNSKAKQTRAFSLRSDLNDLLTERWLDPGERLLTFRPIDEGGTAPGLEGIPVPRTAGQRVRRVLFFTGLALLFALLIPIAVYVWLESLGGESDDGEDTRRRRPLYAWGDGRESAASRAVVPTLGRTGVWILTDQRLAFLALNGSTTASSKHATGESHLEAGPIEVEPLVEVAANQYSYESRVERTHTTWLLRRRKPIGAYYRVAFPDGSGIDLRNRYSRI